MHQVITYDLFCQTVQKMQTEGEKITVRAIFSHTGGSFPKIAIFLKQWRQEQAHAQTIDHELSPNLKQAILVEIGKAVTTIKSLLEKQLAQTSEQLDETIEALTKQEKALEDNEQQINQLKQQLAVAKQLHDQQKDNIQALEKKLAQAIDGQYQNDKRAAIAEMRCAELEKQLTKMEKQETQKITKKAAKKDDSIEE